MLTTDEKRMLRVVAAYNDCTEEQAQQAIVKDFLSWLMSNEETPMNKMELPIEKPEPVMKSEVVLYDNRETPEQPMVRKKPGRKPKNFVEDTIREVRQNEKMSKDEFVDYFGGKG